MKRIGILFIIICILILIGIVVRIPLFIDESISPLMEEVHTIKEEYSTTSIEYKEALVSIFKKAIDTREFYTAISINAEVDEILTSSDSSSENEYFQYLEDMCNTYAEIQVYTSALLYNDKQISFAGRIYQGDELLIKRSLLYLTRALLYKRCRYMEEAHNAAETANNLISQIENKDNRDSRHFKLQYQILLGLLESNYDSAIGKISYAIASYDDWIIEIQAAEVDSQDRNQYILFLKECLADAFVSAGELCQDNGRVGIAKECFFNAFEIFREIISARDVKYVKCINSIIECDLALGLYAEAMILLDENVDTIVKCYGVKNDLYAICSKNRAIYYNIISDYDRAKQYIQEAIDIIVPTYGTNNKEYASCMFLLSEFDMNLGNLDLVDKHLWNIHNKYDWTVDINDRLEMLHLFGKLYFLKGYSEKCLEMSVEFAETLNENEYIRYSPQSAVWLADFATFILFDGDKYDIDNCKAVLVLLEELEALHNPIAIQCLYSLALAYIYSGESIPDSYFEMVMPILAKHYTTNLAFIPEQERYDIWVKFYSNLKDVLFSTGKASQYSVLFDFMLHIKSLLLQTYINFRAALLNFGDSQLLEDYNIASWAQTHINIEAKPYAINNTLVDLGKASAAIERKIIYTLRQTNDYSREIDLSFTDVRSKLHTTDIAIEYVDYEDIYTGNTEYVALLLRKNWDAPKLVKICNNKELEHLYRLRPEHIYWQQDTDKQNELIQKYYRDGYELIWAKLEPYINEEDGVYFSPSGLLHQINIEVLQDENGRLANEKYNLHRVSSTRELCIERPKIEHTSAVLYGGLKYNMNSTELLAQNRTYSQKDGYTATRGFITNSTSRGIKWGYLEGTKNEILQIENYLHQNNISATSYIAQAGTEESFKALSGKQTPIIHLATHGFFYTNEEAQNKSYFEMLTANQTSVRPDNSLKRSGLIMAGAQRAWDGKDIPDSVEDGILLAEEIATMDLSGTDLVVLSACETGLGEITSEGVFGLQRAFKKAGVQTLIMSLWKVDDAATKLMMTTFYKEWLSGKSKHEAFVTAQQRVRNEYNNPYYWASFVMLD